MSEARERGFYWVKYKGEWEVAVWYAGSWGLTETSVPYDGEEFDEIGPRIEPPAADWREHCK
jgi:hypothetical protein